MTDGVVFVTLNQQGGDRGETQLRSQNWFMIMATHPAGPGTLSLKGMFSAEPATVTARGYSELFQTGEAYQGLQNIDRQHPHDLFSQLAAAWHVPIASRVRFGVAGAPVGEATLGPVSFMHRPSASENPTVPLMHHSLDSTHIVDGVVATAVDIGAWTAEASVFHGREPDEHRYDVTVGALDSWATRLWLRAGPWLAQASYGFLKEPEQLEAGNIERTTGSLSWLHARGDDLVTVMAAVGRNKRTYTDLSGLLVEATVGLHKNFVYGRVEVLGIETESLLFPAVVHKPHPGELVDVMDAFTIGGVRDLPKHRGLQLGVGADVTFYDVPDILRFTYGARPVSLHVFLRVRPPAGGGMGRMWNMTMAQPMTHSGMTR
jgi:hypothetical protein